jgi:hypothetical protein
MIPMTLQRRLSLFIKKIRMGIWQAITFGLKLLARSHSVTATIFEINLSSRMLFDICSLDLLKFL